MTGGTAAPTFDPGFTTPALTAALSPGALITAMCRFEEALATASARAGVVPDEVAATVVDRCRRGVADAHEVLRDGWERGTPVVALLERLRADLDDRAAGALHGGATSQDVLDTATMLLLRDGLGIIGDDLRDVARPLAALAQRHRDDPTDGWTLGQRATATTVGHRCARWLAPLVTLLGRLPLVTASLPVQLGGPTGTLAALGDAAEDVVAGVAATLGLVVPPITWHTDRTPVRDVVGWLTDAAVAAETIASDLVVLAGRGEASMRAGVSSAMPDKRNPIDAVRAVAAARACVGAAATVLHAPPHELERAAGSWQAEWWAVPMTTHTAGAAVAALRRAVASLTLHPATADPDAGPSGPAAGRAVDRVTSSLRQLLDEESTGRT